MINEEFPSKKRELKDDEKEMKRKEKNFSFSVTMVEYFFDSDLG